MDDFTHIVCRIVAYRTRRESYSVGLSQRLTDDLRLSPLNLAIVAIEVEEVAGVSIPMEDLMNMVTVRDMVEFVCIAVAQKNADVAGRTGSSKPSSDLKTVPNRSKTSGIPSVPPGLVALDSQLPRGLA